jgi:hypothetical protein
MRCSIGSTSVTQQATSWFRTSCGAICQWPARDAWACSAPMAGSFWLAVSSSPRSARSAGLVHRASTGT